jgi:hypothetical protein
VIVTIFIAIKSFQSRGGRPATTEPVET